MAKKYKKKIPDRNALFVNQPPPSLKELTADPAKLFQKLSDRLGGMTNLARYLHCTRGTAYNLIKGGRKMPRRYLQKALSMLGDHPIINVNGHARAKYEMPPRAIKFTKPQAMILACDGAFLIIGNELWPLIADGQHFLYRNVAPIELKRGDIVILTLPSEEQVVKAWYPSEKDPDEVYLGSLYRGPKEFRQDLFKPFKVSELEDLRKVVGIWMG